jgi:hypothetical protein
MTRLCQCPLRIYVEKNLIHWTKNNLNDHPEKGCNFKSYLFIPLSVSLRKEANILWGARNKASLWFLGGNHTSCTNRNQ